MVFISERVQSSHSVSAVVGELDIAPDALEQELDFIQARITEAIGHAGISSTRRLCHQINFATALRLHQSLSLPIVSFDKSLIRTLRKSPAAIGYVHNGGIYTEPNYMGLTAHSYPLVIGLDPEVILVDAANDQKDPAVPFLVAKLRKQSFFQDLKETSHRIVDKWKTESILEQVAEELPRILAMLYGKSHITEDELAISLQQLALESAAGMRFLFMLNRNWLTYFARALGVAYPSMQRVLDVLRDTIKIAGRELPESAQDRQLEEIVRRLI